MAKKIKRRKHHEIKEDKFVTSAFLVSEFVSEHWKKLALAAAAIIVLVIIIIAVTARAGNVQRVTLVQFDEALRLYKNGELNKAEEAFLEIINEYGSSKYRDISYIYLGKINLEKDSIDVELARDYFMKARSKVSTNLMKEAAWMGLAQCDRLEMGDAVYYEDLEKILKKFPKSYNVPQLAFDIAEYYFENENYSKAKKYYKVIRDNYPSSNHYMSSGRQLEFIESLEQGA
ncbi:MAG TPA: tetratricopeptide repeat protein [Candidatus Cloacimonetes bacterium]|nr:tetratricopeptide repeat protein [Candidatus Cloacimonadota bacterium]